MRLPGPMPDGSHRLNLVNPGDKLSTMCETQAVQTLRTNAQLRAAAKEEEGEFLDMESRTATSRFNWRRIGT